METKRRIYSCAFQLFQERGFDSVKITDIVKKAHVSVGAFYYHFPTKENLIDEGYRDFDEKLNHNWEKDSPLPGVETIKYLITGQLEDVAHKGHEITGIFFKNQLGTSNTYLFSKDRFLYKKLLEQIIQVNPTDIPSEEIADRILRTSRGIIYDWCLHNGKYDVVETGVKEIDMILSHYGIQ
ncbi:MAG TPA: TetR/AcrR family transcriptional regulator [Bacillota bacterium]|nr:TetR/AcrR family transcriptional regulator [Bacillota bacterium]